MKEPVPSLLPTSLPSDSPHPLRFLIIGAGSRGNAYARAVTTSTVGVIHAVAEPHPFKRRQLGHNYIWGTNCPQEGQEFTDWREWLAWETRRRQSASTTTPSNQSSPTLTRAIPTAPAATTAGVDGVFICTLDETHAEIIHAIAPLRLHILCEKPLALSLGDCLGVYRVLQPSANTSIFSIGHVLRYSPHNILLRRLLRSDCVIGEIVSLEHCEPVGWWHFAHSYVRGNWRRETPEGDGSLLTKSCHDIDFIMWLLSSPVLPDAATATTAGSVTTHHHHHHHPPRTITSTGSLTQFHPHRKPLAAGTATNCLDCPAEPDCKYSAVKIYNERHVARGDLDWPVNIVCPDIEDVVAPYLPKGEAAAAAATSARTATGPAPPTSTSPKAIAAASAHLLARLRASRPLSRSNPGGAPSYGHCVYEADNNVCDDQVVTITWSDQTLQQGQQLQGKTITVTAPAPASAKTAIFHMIAPTEKQCERRGRVYGTEGELAYDGRRIEYYRFATRETTVIDVPKQPPEEEKAHGGGDYGLARGFVAAVDAVVNGGWAAEKAQAVFVGCTLEEAVRSHAVVFAAEEARREEKVVRWTDWWEGKLELHASPGGGAPPS
ncbi:Gfo/Idh/MocA family protein [Aspergillus saccharolyticus JOP 1030-1]|uniref:NAD(P)-binding protein n=1 Tax=Aspergillus saccharolyticus JOP 1030-1 TaxID=1450539 RepID=A0A318ZNI1_9EURO|nr:NAD(P)-binding protein [Aspergillus saccharolyticus JOP 1030-1]PYH45470.1 NAD(P)-binding protein [Aspergillus saccharolyticus JOP 1030-1]